MDRHRLKTCATGEHHSRSLLRREADAIRCDVAQVGQPSECFGKLGGRFLPSANAAARTPSTYSEKGLRRPERERFRFLGREHRNRQRPGSLRDGGRHPASSVRPNTFSIRPPLCPWSLPSAGFPRGPASGLMPAPRLHAATSVGAPRRHRSTRSCRSILRAGSSGVTRRSGPCRATSRRNSAAISSAASSASGSAVRSVRAAARGLSSRSRASGAGCAHPAMAGTWHRPPHTLPRSTNYR